jgi:hypothetical protein
MGWTDYVGDAAGVQAKSFEKRLQGLKPEAGILFVSVKAVPTKDGNCKSFEVRLGVHRGIGESAGVALVRFTFRDEIERGLKFLVSAYQGVSGAARAYDGDEEAGTTPS